MKKKILIILMFLIYIAQFSFVISKLSNFDNKSYSIQKNEDNDTGVDFFFEK